jgi:glycosyltransferase involved in cell wall biosynthesis
MGEPFFSVLLPTKNRSEILGGAIRSVLDQTFGDFELIVSDNDDSPDATRAAVQAFNDPRIVYVRTSGKLPMHENWDNAFSHAKGRHVLLLEDKMRFVTNAFEIIRASLPRDGSPMSFGSIWTAEATLSPPSQAPATKRLESKRIIDGFAKFRPGDFVRIPKGFDSCVPRETLVRMKKASPTGFLYSYICPDYSFGFLLLSQVDHIDRLEEPLSYVPNNWIFAGNYSNGGASYRKDSLARVFLNGLPIKPEDITSRVPVKIECLWLNMVLYDFFTKYRRADHQPHINWHDYHACVMAIILMGKKFKAPMLEEREAIRMAFRREGWFFRFRVLWGFGLHLFLVAKSIVAGRIARRFNRRKQRS